MYSSANLGPLATASTSSAFGMVASPCGSTNGLEVPSAPTQVATTNPIASARRQRPIIFSVLVLILSSLLPDAIGQHGLKSSGREGVGQQLSLATSAVILPPRSESSHARARSA